MRCMRCARQAELAKFQLCRKGDRRIQHFVLHAVDATGVVHAMLLRIQALLQPIKTLVLSGQRVPSECSSQADS